MIELPTRTHHIKNLEPLEEIRGDDKWREELGDLRMAAYLEDHAVTLLDQGEPVAVMGVVMIREGVAEGWAVFSKTACKHPTATMRHCKRILGDLSNRYGLHRLQAAINPNFKRGIHFAQRMDFEVEGLMKHYFGRGHDAILMARIYAKER